MSDGKLTYDIDFNVNTQSISDAITRAVSGGVGQHIYNDATSSAYEAALQGLAYRKGRNPSTFLKGIMNKLDTDLVSNVSDFAKLASDYDYRPSTIQAAINSAAAAVLRSSKKSPDWTYKLDAQAATTEIREIQRENRASSLAAVYAAQGKAFADAAKSAVSPAVQKLLLSRAASRYGSIASRTLIEAGGVSTDTAIEALGISAGLGEIRSGIKTEAQIARENSAMWKSRVGSENKAAAIKAAQEDAAWGSIGYSESQKTRDMERGFRAMEASSATEAIYNPDRDPAVQRWNFGASIYSAAQYAAAAEKAPEGSIARQTNIALAQQSLRGVSIDAMARSDMNKDELMRNTQALIGVTNLLKSLMGGGAGSSGDGGAGRFVNGIPGMVASGVEIAADVMATRTSWLADTKTPYQTRRAALQDKAISYGKTGMWAGAASGAAVGASIGGIPGAAIGGLIGLLPGAASLLTGQHYSDEKKIGDAQQAKAIDMNRYRNLYGNRVEYNYSQLVENMGYAPASSMFAINEQSAMLPGAMMFGGVSEQQMVGLSYLPNYWAALMEGKTTSETLAAAKRDLQALPKEMQPYVWKMAGGNEDTRAFMFSNSFDVAQGLASRISRFDTYQYGFNNRWEGGRQLIAATNVAESAANYANETSSASLPNIVKNPDDMVKAISASLLESEAAMALHITDSFIQGGKKGYIDENSPYATKAINLTRDWYYRNQPFNDEIFSSPAGDINWVGHRAENMQWLASLMAKFFPEASNGVLGNIIINVDGDTVYDKPYKRSDFNAPGVEQTYVIGGLN